jgi:hypothetical protein
MIFTALYYSPLLCNNEHRNIYLYTIGTLIYTALHWILFYTVGNKSNFIQKYRNAIYGIVVIDLLFVKNKYSEYAKNVYVIPKHTPIIEKLSDENDSHQKCDEECNNKICNSEQCPIKTHNKIQENVSIQNDIYSTTSLPIYEPIKQINNNICDEEINIYEPNVKKDGISE